MKRIAIIPVLCSLAGSSAWAIDCMTAPGDPKSGWYAWREIEGRKCWFKKTGAMPPKSQLHWSAKAEKEQPPAEPSPAVRTVPVAARPQEIETTKPPPKPAPVSHFTTLPVRPTTAAPLRLGHGQIDLMSGASLSGAEPLGSGRQNPQRFIPADPFEKRFLGSP